MLQPFQLHKICAGPTSCIVCPSTFLAVFFISYLVVYFRSVKRIQKYLLLGMFYKNICILILLYSHLKKKKKQMHIVCSLFFLTSVILKLCLHTKCNKIWGKIYGDWLVLNAFLFWGKLFLITMAFHILLSHVSCSGGCSQALHLPVICSYFCM